MVDNQEAGDYSGIISRRRFVQVAGVSGAAALAGCGGGDTTTEAPADTDTETPDDTGEDTTEAPGDDTPTEEQTKVYDVTYANLNDNAQTADVHWNYINGSNYASWPAWTTYDRGMAYNFVKGEYIPYAFTSVNIDGKTVTIEIREDLKWADGTDYTSQHAKEEITLSNLVGSPLWNYLDSLDSVKTPEDKKLVLELNEAANKTILKHAIANFGTNLRAKEGTPYAEYYNAAAENGIDNVSEDVQKKVNDWAPSTPPMTCAPFVHDKQDANGIRLKRNPEHPDAKNINFKYYEWGSSPGNQHKQAQLVSGKVNAVMSLFAPPRIVANMPDRIEESQPPAKWGLGMMPNHERPHVKHREVRQAIQYALDHDTIVKNAGPRTKQAPTTPGGIAASAEDAWLGDKIDSYMTYDETAKGQEVLQKAGYSKQGGTWKDSNGKTAKLTLNVPAGWTDWVTGVQTAVSQLNDFGFAAELNSVPGGAMFGDIVPNSKFQLQAYWWLPGGARSDFPYYPLRHQYGQAWGGDNPHNYPAWNGGEGKEMTYPSMDGGEVTLNPVTQVEEISTMQDAEKVKERIQQLHWINNVDQPMIPFTEKKEQSWYQDGGDWEGPSGDSEAAGVKWPSCWLPRHGDIKYVGGE